MMKQGLSSTYVKQWDFGRLSSPLLESPSGGSGRLSKEEETSRRTLMIDRGQLRGETEDIQDLSSNRF
ncbi:hypothetical protein BDZ89DRAFT_1056516 [Hymenopellis radicata]|nr:hypothetical protein BDZ89DRAFT_1056516 [Hymenopellis radicata]